jgi:hypothetical protein
MSVPVIHVGLTVFAHNELTHILAPVHQVSLEPTATKVCVQAAGISIPCLPSDGFCSLVLLACPNKCSVCPSSNTSTCTTCAGGYFLSNGICKVNCGAGFMSSPYQTSERLIGRACGST